MDVMSVDSVSVGVSGGSQYAAIPPAAKSPEKTASSEDATQSAEGKQGTEVPGSVAKAIEKVNSIFGQYNKNIYASYHKDKITGIDVVQFRDANTNKVIRQIPSKEILAIAQSLSVPPGMQGQLIYEKA
ncbi:MAG: flagellar protein FlaG [Sulfuricellaceae bacterium]|jgi:flagellar protein FlaG